MRDLVRASYEPVVFEPNDLDLWERAYARFRELVSEEVRA